MESQEVFVSMKSVGLRHGQQKIARRDVAASSKNSGQGTAHRKGHKEANASRRRFRPTASHQPPIPKTKPQPLVLVEWVDTYGCSASWQNLDAEDPYPLRCQSVGWLLRDSPECKVIVPHLTTPHEYASRQGCGDMTIPTGAILSITRLRRAKR